MKKIVFLAISVVFLAAGCSRTELATTINSSPSTPSSEDTTNWKTFRSEYSFFTLKYPETLKVSCPGDSGCQLLSTTLDSNTNYSFDLREENPHKLSEDAFAMTGFTFYSADGKDLKTWRSSWEPTGLNPNATYRTFTINGLPALEEKTSKHKAIFILHEKTIHQFILIPLNKANEELLDKVLGTVSFNSTTKQNIEPNFTKTENSGYHGDLNLTGYMELGEISDFADKKSAYAYFKITNSDNQLIYDFIKDYKGNSFVGDSSIGLGCYDKSKQEIYSVNESDNGSMVNSVSGDQFKKLLASSKANLVQLKVTKAVYTSGRGASACYSHFRNFQLK